MFYCILATYGLIAFVMAIKCDKYTIFAFELFVVLQNFLLVIFSGEINQSTSSIFSITKELMLYAGIFFSFLIHGRILSIDGIKRALIPLMLILVPIGAKSILLLGPGLVLTSLRQFILPFACLAVGADFVKLKKDRVALSRSIIYVAVFLSITGFIELYFFGDEFWKNIGLLNFLFNRGSTNIMYTFGMPSSFYTFDFTSYPIRRLVSIMVEPLATAHLLFIGLVVLTTRRLAMKKTTASWVLSIVVIGIACCLSLSKAVFVGFAVLIACLIWYKSESQVLKLLTVLICVSISLLIFINLGSNSSLEGTSTGNHVNGLIEGLVKGGLFGNGLGSAGYNVVVSSGELSIGSESFVGVLASQIGICGLIAFFIPIGWLLKISFDRYKLTNNYMYVSVIILLWMLIADMLFSESSISISGTGLYFIYIGAVLSQFNLSDGLSLSSI